MDDRVSQPRPKQPVDPADVPLSHMVGIGAPAGGGKALEEFFQALPPHTDLSFVMVQHLSPNFKRVMDELLARATTIAIQIVTESVVPQPNTIYLMPTGSELILANGELEVMTRGPETTIPRPIDRFFASLAQSLGARAIGIVMSGTGSDGSRGIADIHEAGGLVMVQEPKSAQFDGMPLSALATGLVDLALTPAQMADTLLTYVANRDSGRQYSGMSREEVAPPDDDRLHLIEQELYQTKAALQTTGEEWQARTEELQTANEELVASNEELQSVNEELHTVNAAYQLKNQQLAALHTDIPLEAEDGQLMAAAIRDVTERKRAEMLQRQMGELERKNAALQSQQASLDAAVAALERSNADLDAFISIASHDLKEPLRGIRNYAQMLQEDCVDQLSPSHQDDLDTLGRLVQRLEQRIEDLRTYACIGRIDVEPERLDMEKIVAEVCEQLAVLLAEQHVSLRLPHPLPTVRYHRSHLVTVLQNLIANAARYNDKAERWVEIGCQAQSAPRVFYVRDNGIGIPRHLQDEAFLMFRRLHGEAFAGSGSGAGLAIVRRILEGYGGRVWLASQPGQGTTVFFTLGTVEEGRR